MKYDVIIVGARVAGSSLALLLGRQGRRVLLVDRDTFPSDTLSTHLIMPPGVDLLARLGVLDAVEASGVRRITRQRTYLGRTLIEGDLRAPGLYAICPRRDQLDLTLIDHALRQPAVDLMEGTRVEELIWEDGRVTGVRLNRGGSEETVHATVVVGADGKYSKVAEWVKARRYDEVLALRPVYYAYYGGVTPLAEPAVEVFHQDGRIAYLLPMEPGRDCLALELQAEEFASFRRDPARRLHDIYQALPGMAARLAGAQRDGFVRGTRGVDNCLREPAGPGWALTGDAAMSKDPSTGTGIEDGIRQSFLLAEALGTVLDGGDWTETMTAFHRRRDETVAASFKATLAYTRTQDASPEALSWLHAVAANAGIARLVGNGLFAALQAPGVFSPGLLATIERSAALFAEAAGQTPQPAMSAA